MASFGFLAPTLAHAAFHAFVVVCVFGFAEMERSVIRERQKEGIAIAKEKGVYKGRKPKLTVASVEAVKQRIAAGEKKAASARTLGVSRQTLYSYL
jgi:DNA invertase Pin-like site-specific DNA recombinase